MKIAIISDIHSNPNALRKCLKHAEDKGCEKIVCLGDIVGYGYDPNTCIDICRKEVEKGRMQCVLGNHDAGVIGKLSLRWFSYFASQGIERQRTIVSNDNKQWLESLPYAIINEDNVFKVAYAHGTYDRPERFDYVNYLSDAAFEFPRLKSEKIAALFVGHTHCANAYEVDKNYNIRERFIDLEDEKVLDLSLPECSIVNAGSVGYPRNQPYTLYVIYDADKMTATFQILEFDFADYRKQMKDRNIEIPLWLERSEKEAKERPVLFR